jgi:hypothetical protein
MGREGWTIGKVPVILPLSDNLAWMRMDTSEANPSPPFTPDGGEDATWKATGHQPLSIELSLRHY